MPQASPSFGLYLKHPLDFRALLKALLSDEKPLEISAEEWEIFEKVARLASAQAADIVNAGRDLAVEAFAGSHEVARQSRTTVERDWFSWVTLAEKRTKSPNMLWPGCALVEHSGKALLVPYIQIPVQHTQLPGIAKQLRKQQALAGAKVEEWFDIKSILLAEIHLTPSTDLDEALAQCGASFNDLASVLPAILPLSPARSLGSPYHASCAPRDGLALLRLGAPRAVHRADDHRERNQAKTTTSSGRLVRREAHPVEPPANQVRVQYHLQQAHALTTPRARQHIQAEGLRQPPSPPSLAIASMDSWGASSPSANPSPAQSQENQGAESCSRVAARHLPPGDHSPPQDGILEENREVRSRGLRLSL